MNGHQLFDLEKIKDLTNPIEELQGNVFELENNYAKFFDFRLEIFQFPLFSSDLFSVF